MLAHEIEFSSRPKTLLGDKRKVNHNADKYFSMFTGYANGQLGSCKLISLSSNYARIRQPPRQPLKWSKALQVEFPWKFLNSTKLKPLFRNCFNEFRLTLPSRIFDRTNPFGLTFLRASMWQAILPHSHP